MMKEGMDFDLILYSIVGTSAGLLESYYSITKYSSASSTTLSSPSKDHGSMILIWLTILCSNCLCAHYVRLGYGLKIFLGFVPRFAFSVPVGIGLFVTGNLIRRQAIQQLGKWFTVAVRTNSEQQLIDSGWYRRMRHPSYTGVLMYFLGLALLMNNWLGIFVMWIPIVLVFLYRIRIEERELKKHFGSKYDQYARRVPAVLIPKIF